MAADVQGQVWWVTGASSGIGAALAAGLAAAGARLILSGRNRDALAAAAARCPGESLILPFEATDLPALPGVVAQAWDWQGRIDGLVNNAGISQRSLAEDTAFTVYERIIAVDLLAPIALTQTLLPRLIAAGGGRIVAISSLAGVMGVPLRTAYCAAKHGLIGYHDALRAETAHQGVGVLVVCPGSVRTEVSRNALGPDGAARGESDPAIDNGLPPESLAAQILEALRDGRRELLVGHSGEVDLARLRRADPDRLFDAMAAMVAAGYAQRMGAQKS